MKSEELQFAVIYARVSSRKQVKEGHGLESQEARCREYAARCGYDVIEVFQDNRSGKLIDRPGMKAMLQFLRKRRSDEVVIIIDDISRLARGMEAHIHLRSAIQKVGAVLESPSIEFGEDSDSILVENLLASVSQHQRQKNGEQVKNRMRARLMGGYRVFQAPVGYRYENSKVHGKIIVPDEPIATIIREALEGYATGRFETKAEVQRFFMARPEFPRDGSGKVRAQLVNDILTRVLYAGYVEAQKWNIDPFPGHHEGLISLETYQAIQRRLKGAARAPARKDINRDFPLRGFVECGDCGHAMTSSHSKGRSRRYPYYLCQKKGCDSYGKSIPREVIEGEFVQLLQGLQPTRQFFMFALEAFADLWAIRMGSIDEQRQSLRKELTVTTKQGERLLERIIHTEDEAAVPVYEKRLSAIELRKQELKERIENCGRALPTFKEVLEPRWRFSQTLTNSGNQAVLKTRERCQTRLCQETDLQPRNGL